MPRFQNTKVMGEAHDSANVGDKEQPVPVSKQRADGFTK